MCSIFGQVISSGKLVNKEKFINASNILSHRGPDKKGYFTDDNLFQFSFNRLSIIDLSTSGDQPMESSCGRYIGVFNGEIYNHKKIYDEIKNFFEWKGTSDTEILMNAWSIWQKKALEKLDGMFSIAIWDKQEKIITLIRDRIGEKPLYYYLDNQNSFYFCSRPGPIVDIFSEMKKDFSIDSLTFYFDSGYFPRTKSVYQKIKKLEPGCLLEFKNNEINIEKYWSVDDFNVSKKNLKSLDVYVEEFDSLLKESITERLISDKPIGFLLSGGLDSSLIVAIASKILEKSNINVFNLGFENSIYDESNDARLVTNYLDIDLIERRLDAKNLLELMDTFFDKFDEPFSDPACFPLMAISKFAKEKVDVVLTGDGGDELFGGYHYYNLMNYHNQFKNLFSFLRKIKISEVLRKIDNHKLKLLGNFLHFEDDISRYAFIRSSKKDFQNIYKDQSNFSLKKAYFDSVSEVKKDENILSMIMKLDIKHTLNDNYLQKTDLSSMSFSLESRAPFLSKKIIEWSLTIPKNYKVNLFQKKIILKKLAKKYLPKEIIDKKKQGFEPPIKYWLKDELKEWSLDLITNKKNYINLNIDQNKIIDIFKLHLSGKRDCHPYLWTILMILKFNEK